MPQIGTWIKTDGTETIVHPWDGKKFQLAELQKALAAIHHAAQIFREQGVIIASRKEGGGAVHGFGWEAFLDDGIISGRVFCERAGDQMLDIFEIALRDDRDFGMVIVPMAQHIFAAFVFAEAEEGHL